MTATCVLMIVNPIGGRITLDIDMSAWPVIPQVGDTMFWHPDWGGERVEARYVSSDGIELYLGRVGEHSVADHLAAGWTR